MRRDHHIVEREQGIVGIGRLSKVPHQNRAEFAAIVTDAMQGQGLGTELIRRLIDIARQEGLTRLTADILQENKPMQAVCRKLGFSITGELGDSTVRAELKV